MPDPNQQGAQPAQQKVNLGGPTGAAPRPASSDRRDKFYLAIATSIMGRQTRSPHALAKECRDFTDAFLAALDSPVGA